MSAGAVSEKRAVRIGERVWPIDWELRTVGGAAYLEDQIPAGALIGAILRSPHPHAAIEAIDITEAVRMPGVHSVITAKDFAPGVRYASYGSFDRPPLADEVVRFVGQEVAAAAADTLEQALAALAAIKVRYRPLKGPLDIESALAPDAVALHAPLAPTAGSPAPTPFPGRNVRRGGKRLWGDPDQGLGEAVTVASGLFRYPQQNQCCMETHRALAEWTDGRLHMWASTATPLILKGLLAAVLKVDAAQVVVHEVAVGGSFGAKLQINGHEAPAAMLARETGRPVVIVLTREEEFETTYTRHGYKVGLTLRADVAGRFQSFDATVRVDNGAYLHSGNAVMGASLMALGGAYRMDGVRIDAKLVDTAKVPGGAFRGYGGPQTTFPRESLIDEVAAALGRDPIELRIQNAYGSDTETLTGHVGTNGTVDCLQAVREASGWTAEKANPVPGRGIGVAVGEHLSGAHTFPNSNRADSTLDLFADGRLRLRYGGADAGTGQNTILAQVASQELGVPWDRISVLSMDTDETPMEWGAWSSRGTHYTAHSVGLTSRKFAERLRELAALRLGPGEIRLEEGFARSADGEVALGDLIAMSNASKDGVLSHTESFVDASVEIYDPSAQSNFTATHNFAAHAAIVEVDEKTGKVRIVDYVAASDSGTVMNPLLMEGQIAGAVVMGMGGALGEELIFEQGKVVNPAFLSYAVPRAADVPGVRIVHAGLPDKRGPYGAKGAGELGINPVAPAVANAVFDAVGARIRSAPLTPDKILVALRAKSGRQRDFHLWRRPGRWYVEAVRRLYPYGLFQVLHWWQLRKHGAASPPPPPIRSIVAPASVAELLEALGPDAALLGGGTDLQLRRRQKITTPATLVAVAGVAEMRRLEVSASGGVVAGAAVTLSELAQALRPILPSMAEAIEEIASPQIRNVATIGGNLAQAKRCWFFRNGFNCYKRRGNDAPCYAVLGDHRFYHAAIDGHRCQAVTPSDLATLLVALDAVITVVGPKGSRGVEAEHLYTGPGETCLADDEAISHIVIPAEAVARRTAYRKLNLWQGDFAVASAALSVSLDVAGRCAEVRLSLGAVAPTPIRARATERKLLGRPLTMELLRAALDEELDERGHPLARNSWKLDAVAGLAERAAEEIGSA